MLRRYRLNAPTMVIRDPSPGHPADTVVLPKGAEISTTVDVGSYAVTDCASLIAIEYGGEAFSIRSADLLERGELLRGATG